MKIRPIYHLHIPRTSGTKILRELEKAESVSTQRADSLNHFAKLKVYVPGEYEFILPTGPETEN